MTDATMKKQVVKALTSSQRIERDMRLVGAYFSLYAMIGFGYPIATGESVLETLSKRMGWKQKDQECLDCQSYYDKQDKDSRG